MRPLIQFFLKHYYFIFFLFLEVIAVLLFVNNNYYQKSIAVNATNSITGSVYTSFNNFSQYLSLTGTNKLLAEENARLLSLQQSSFIKTDNRIFVYDDTLYRQQYEYVSAKVINNSTNMASNYLMLNKGSKHGIKKDMAVICSEGVVGIVDDVSENFTSVRSLQHPKSKISAKIKKNNYAGTVVWEGKGYGNASLKDVPTHVKIKVGDTVITSGFSFMFPEGVMVGIITGFQTKKSNDFYMINVKLSTDFNNIGYVYVVKDMMKDEQDKLKKSIKGDE